MSSNLWMNDMPKTARADALVSVCITSYNYGRYIRDAIESALTQSYPHIEVIVSDNASTDETHDVLNAYAHDPRVKVFFNEHNVGLCKNHNLAIQRATGDYIVVLSADDILFPEHVDRLMRRMCDPFDPVLIAFGQGVLLDEQLASIRPIFSYGNLSIPYSRRDDFGNVLFNYNRMYPALLVARCVYDAVGLFDERLLSSIDIEICARFEAADVPTAFIPELVAGFREHGKRTSGKLRHDTNEFFHDKLHMYEHALDPQHAWRIEGYEAGILAIADMELGRLAAEGAAPLDERQSPRMQKLRDAFAASAQQTPAWPVTEPQLSVVVISEGYLALLHLTLDAVAAQQLERVEILIVQVSGCDVAPVIARLPYAGRVRVVQAADASTPGHAFRYGCDLARGEYVAYLTEGQLVGHDVYAGAVSYARAVNAQMVLLPKAIIDDGYLYEMYREFHPQRFADPASRARARAAGPEYALCQLVHRRAIMRAGATHYETMVNAAEHDFMLLLAGLFRTVTLSLAAA